MTRIPAYSPRVRALFADPPRAGRLPDGPGERLAATAGGPAAGAWIELEARVADGRVTAAAFRAWGCPHVIAAAAWLAGRLEGRPLDAAGEFDPQALAAELELPPEKLGRLLVLQDAARALASTRPRDR